MVYKCCIPNCRSNYKNGQKMPVYRFPKKDELLKKWLLAIPRENFKPSKHSRVCQLHFDEGDIVECTEAIDEQTGQIYSAKLQNKRLRRKAIPCKFPNCPEYLSKNVTQRENPDVKRRKIEMNQLQDAIKASILTAKSYNETHLFENFEDMLHIIKSLELPKDWNFLVFKDYVIIFHLYIEQCPQIEKSIVIDKQCVASVYLKGLQLTVLGDYTLPFNISNVNDISKIINLLQNFCKSESTVNDTLTTVCNALSLLIELVEENKKNSLACILEQLNLLKMKKNSYRYSSDFLILSTLLFTISPHSYRFLRSSAFLILPHPNTLKLLCSKLNVNPKNDLNVKYIRDKSAYLQEQDKKVVFLLDEIHLKPFLDFKGGDILGVAVNTENAATTAFVFMIQSITSKYKDVIKILPVQKIDAEFLYLSILKLIIELEKLGFTVVCVSSDNNSINRRAMSFFANPPKQTFVYQHPFDSNRPLFYVRDTVHLFKCVRNNWLNQKNADKCLYFPQFNFEAGSMPLSVKTASFSTLKAIYDIERNEIVKLCHTLTQKAVSPSNLERQNVKLVHQIFNSHVIEGLLEAGPKYNLSNYKDTADFLKIILAWWEIMNVKSIFKGQHKRNVFQTPFVFDETDPKCKFLYSFLDWLDQWKNCNFDNGHLTSETHEALWQTTYAILEIARYCNEDLKLDYILTGKFQTDPLENRFGQYRQLAGGHYNISLPQLLEVENKLRIQSVLPLKLNSNQFGPILIASELLDSENLPLDLSLPKNHIVFLLKKFNFSLDDEDILSIVDIENALAYIAGYCIHSCINRIKCNVCKNNLTLPKDIHPMSFQLIENLDRGGLKFPNSSVVDIITISYLVVSKLISKEYEIEFLKCQNHRAVAYSLIKHFLILEEKSLDFGECENGHSSSLIQKYVIYSCINIFLKNYVKNANSKLTESSCKKRKLKTLVSSKLDCTGGILNPNEDSSKKLKSKKDNVLNKSVLKKSKLTNSKIGSRNSSNSRDENKPVNLTNKKKKRAKSPGKQILFKNP